MTSAAQQVSRVGFLPSSVHSDKHVNVTNWVAMKGHIEHQPMLSVIVVSEWETDVP